MYRNPLSPLFALLIISALPQTVLSRTETDHQACQQLFDNARYSEASSPCQKAAQAGDANAQTLLGELYDGGWVSIRTQHSQKNGGRQR
ncbi:hypothetical protein Ga0074115_11965 [endosymbiont of Ridgeia piscesae]|jgi:hypothetical protein|uniref:Uncharacterized protein n=1 Tax=endosymbiont of Ridgeia piscesae TaxID=54398 RepID=A0A0T5Z596_9GAMM|nr:hypothetical protein Ga0074115_11965 [endosymbiont of Ridgeia piscesae]KRT57931.1 hypothetical protein Ga0076813_12612 [endosymbiont of Ridgeia piscesae]